MTSPRYFESPADLAGASAADLARSSWFLVEQKLIDEFAELTGDRQWIHVDAKRSAVGPFGAPVAHGYLLLALMPQLLAEVLQVGGTALTVNRGLTDVRFHNPVLAGDRIQLAVGSLQVRSRPRD